MDITELGALGELVGGVAVVVSLVYVGLQVRQNTRVTRGQAVTALLSGQVAGEVGPCNGRKIHFPGTGRPKRR